ncbi:hypothetical protein OIU79_016972 [Salix purpurea]|uniref:Uncharacterized protein n=1 Tax=Salix purpurea TaxID=77065 RepID=A0A9Q1AJ90_SALPP|nr:hypothetical protein OIU79_016972 [Salix purpurea]
MMLLSIFRQEKWIINQRRIMWPGGMCLNGLNIWMVPSSIPLFVNKGWETGLIVFSQLHPRITW